MDRRIELNIRHENNSPNGWTYGELYGRHENTSPKGWTAQE